MYKKNIFFLIVLINKLKLKYNKKLYFSAIFTSVIYSIFELLSIGSIVPLVTILFEPEKLENLKYINFYFNYFDNLDELKLVICIIFISLNLISVFLNLLSSFFVYKLSFSSAKKLSFDLFNSSLNLPIQSLINRKNANLKSYLTTETEYLAICFMASTIIFTKLIVVLMLVLFVIIFFNELTPIIILFSLIGTLFFVIFSSKLKIISKKITDINKLNMNNISESTAGFLDTIIFNLKDFFKERYLDYSNKYVKNQLKLHIISLLPRNFLEITFIVISLALALFLSRETDIQDFMPQIFMFGFLAYRIMPNVSNIVYQFSRIKGYSNSIEVIISEIQNNQQESNNNINQNIKFNKVIFLKNILYQNNNFTLKLKKNLLIEKFDKIYLKGPSGIGKTTLLNIISGIIKPNKGEVLIDNDTLDYPSNDWIKKIGYVSQKPYIFYETLKFNITFKNHLDQYEEKRYQEVIDTVNLNDVDNRDIKDLTSDGANLSGGQRQKIAIARAIYKNMEILIFDESFNSIHSSDEQKILDKLYKDEKTTVIITSHRELDKKFYSKLIKLEDYL